MLIIWGEREKLLRRYIIRKSKIINVADTYDLHMISYKFQ